MTARLGKYKASAVYLYDGAVHAPSREAVEILTGSYSAPQAAYLGKFKKAELYRAYSPLQDPTKTSHWAKSQMSATLRNSIRCGECRKKRQKVVELKC